jgi:hypothetical protein
VITSFLCWRRQCVCSFDYRACGAAISQCTSTLQHVSRGVNLLHSATDIPLLSAPRWYAITRHCRLVVSMVAAVACGRDVDRQPAAARRGGNTHCYNLALSLAAPLCHKSLCFLPHFLLLLLLLLLNYISHCGAVPTGFDGV